MNQYEKVTKGLEWCIRADKQCVYALVDCPYTEQCKTIGQAVLKQEALDLIRIQELDIQSLKNTINNILNGGKEL